MRISVVDAEDQLGELVSRAESGEEVILTKDGRGAVRLVALTSPQTRADREAIIRRLQASAALHMTPGPSAERSQDFLYNEDGLPE